MSRAEEVFATWDSISPEDRAEALGEATNEDLVEQGYAPVTSSEGDLDDDTAAETDPQTGDVTYDRGFLANADAYDAMSTAYHEEYHSMDAQDGVYDRMSEDENDSYNDIEDTITVTDIYRDEPEVERYEHEYYAPGHNEAEQYGIQRADQIRDAATRRGPVCRAPEDQQSAASGGGAPIPWSEPSEPMTPSEPAPSEGEPSEPAPSGGGEEEGDGSGQSMSSTGDGDMCTTDDFADPLAGVCR